MGIPFLSTFWSHQGEKFGCRSGRDDLFTRQGVKHGEGLRRASVHDFLGWWRDWDIRSGVQDD